ncbi:hypothetical protein CYLTODRAFT_425327 [Cylindrobasidium torrendii FP15055 ss-10]|uniref:F-box domain-containing protein n=1 Tax=Cylindrobasidium torrendii FP15055 ss-10 TaxID=1314674 RepID=A0A0D7B2D5_9AGAR|nr:hypothetical protein CYLTODRAFT_425327 [Cylindrobasidium torrendii FP15055 ss-10]
MIYSVLELDDDVLGVICSWVRHLAPLQSRGILRRRRRKVEYATTLRSLACTNKRFRALCTPFLFQRVRFVFQAGWDDRSFDEIHDALQQGWNSSIAYYARSLRVTMWFSHDQLSAATNYRQQLFELFSDAIIALPHLKRLEICELREMCLKDELSKHIPGYQFLCVRELVVQQDQWQIIAACPNTRSLKITVTYQGDDLLKMFEAAGSLQHLKSFSYDLGSDAADTLTDINSIQKYIPRLEQLLVYEVGDYYAGILPGLGGFKHLQTLVLPFLDEMNVGYRTPRNRNTFAGRHGNEARLRLTAHEKALRERLAQETFKACRCLQAMWIGHRLKVSRAAGGEGLHYDFEADWNSEYYKVKRPTRKRTNAYQ